jgi:hypothetical protein
MSRHGYIEVRVVIGDGYPLEQYASRHDIGESLIWDILVPLDEPSRNASGFGRALCSPAPLIQHTKRLREHFSEHLAREIAQAVEKALASKDTLMGYPHERQAG